MRGSDTSEVLLQNCRVSAENLLGTEGKGAAILMSGLDYERLVLAGGPLEIMRACMDLVLPYVHDRKAIRSGNWRVSTDARQAGGHVHHDE